MKIKYNLSIKRQKELFLISELFHENTKLNKSHLGMGMPPYLTDVEIKRHLLTNKRKYHYLEIFNLPTNYNKLNISFEEVITRRRSIRDFSKEGLSLKEVSILLYYAYGITGYAEVLLDGIIHRHPLRSSASGGALYPIDIFLVSFKVSDLKKGIYYFNSVEHRLELIRGGNFLNFFYDNCPKGFLDKSLINNSSIILVLCADFSRNKFKYGERGYRYVLLDAGHLGQNIYLVATYMDLGVVGFQGFYDDEINRLFGFDGVEESVIYLFSLGKKLKFNGR